MSDRDRVRSIEDRLLLDTLRKPDVVLDRGSGMYLWDLNGRKYLDYYAGHGVVSTGHAHPKVVEAIRLQAERLLFFTGLCYSPARAHALERLRDLLPTWLDKVFLVNSGAEAVEAALRTAMRLTGRSRIVAMEGSFHGRTTGALSVTGLASYRKDVSGLWQDVVWVSPAEADAVASAVDDRTAAAIVEPVQGLGGCRAVPEPTLRALRAACDRHGAFMIADEVQCGIGRTGRFLAIEHAGVEADLVVLAKGVASGFPASVFAAGPRVSGRVKPSDLGTTFGGGPLACAAMAATLEVLVEDKLMEAAHRVGGALADVCRSLPGVLAVQGKGLMLGLVLDRPAVGVKEALLAQGVLVGTASAPDVLRLLPPLVIERPHVDEFAERWRAAVA